jgi:hypothetical protein
MKIMRILGVALVAVFAVVAFTATSAMANPSWKACVKSEKGKGEFSDKLCSISAGGTGKYNLVEGVGKGKAFKGKGGKATLHNVIPGKGDIKVECASFKDAGKVADAGGKGLEFGVTATFSKCKSLGGAPCKTEGGKKETITTNVLAGNLGWLNKAGKVAGASLFNEAKPSSGYEAEFECEGLAKVRVHGGVIGAVTPVGVVSKVATTTYTVSETGVGGPEDPNALTNPPAFEEEVVGVLLTELNGPETGNVWAPEGGIPSGQEASAENKGEALEIS